MRFGKYEGFSMKKIIILNFNLRLIFTKNLKKKNLDILNKKN